MKFFVDTADTTEIKELAATGLIDGVTTNPSLITKSGRDFKEVIAEICDLTEGHVSAETRIDRMRRGMTAPDALVRHAAGLARTRGFEITNIDCTIICETPKIGPHAAEMRASLAGITGVGVARISVKATTSEKLGFTGRGEGIAALATAALVKP